MPSTVIVNNMTVVHKTSGGVSVAFPDTCKTPSPGGPVPIPYPNVAMSANTADGSSSVKMDGNPIMLKSSNYSVSTGDEAGSALGVVSNKIKGKAYPRMYSFDVKVDGENVFRQLDLMLQNGGSPTNTLTAPTIQAPAGVAPGQDPDEQKITKIEWDQTEACCGDEVTLTVESVNMEGQLTVCTAARYDPEFYEVDQIHVPFLSGSTANPHWWARRGPQEPEVKLWARARGLGGNRDSENEMLVKTVSAPRREFSEQRKGVLMLPGSWPLNKWSFEFTLDLAAPKFVWDVTYDREITDGEMIITKKVETTLRLAPQPGQAFVFGQQQGIQASEFAAWKQEIEAVWSEKWLLHRVDCERGDDCDCTDCGGCKFPISVVCEFVGNGQGHGERVVVHDRDAQGDRWNSHTWYRYLGSTYPYIRPHEFGHLIGQYDEYVCFNPSKQRWESGAVPVSDASKSSTRVSGTDDLSIMAEGDEVRARHMQEFKDWFDSEASSVIGDTKLLPM